MAQSNKFYTKNSSSGFSQRNLHH